MSRRDGREAPAKPISVRAKTLVAKLLARLIFLAAHSLAAVLPMLRLEHKWPSADVYRLLTSPYESFPNLVPKWGKEQGKDLSVGC